MDCMLDLETMGNNSLAPIVSIGAVAFDKHGVHSEFYRNVDLGSSIKSGAIPDASTIMWWMGQGDSARKGLQSNPVNLHKALTELSEWFALNSISEVWGCGAAFDNVILRNSYNACGLEAPWPFWSDKCYRTVRDMNPDVEFIRAGVHHNALDDAKTQAEHLIKILNK